MACSKPVETLLTLPPDCPTPAGRAVEAQLETSLTAENGICSIDCSRLGLLSPELLYRLWLVCDRCRETGMRVRFEAAAAELDSLLSILDPVHRVPSGDSPGGTTRGSCTGYAQMLGTTTPELDQAAAKLMEFALTQGLTERNTYVLRSLFEEAVSNVARYSGLQETESFFLGVRMDEARTRMVFADCGIAFDPTAWDAATGTVTREPGDARPPFGIRLLLRLSHRARYVRLDEMTNVLMLERDRE